VEEVQKVIHAKMPRSGKMCKDKWNGLNFDYKKFLDYHKGIGLSHIFLGIDHGGAQQV
jgi:hypothetical protein